MRWILTGDLQLDLFQLRRCQEDLAPSPGHPGCIYGEMGKCLRPCQEAVSREEYAGEVEDFSMDNLLRDLGFVENVAAARSGDEAAPADDRLDGAVCSPAHAGRLHHHSDARPLPRPAADALEMTRG